MLDTDRALLEAKAAKEAQQAEGKAKKELERATKAAKEAQQAEAKAKKELERAAKEQARLEARAAYWHAKQEAKAAKEAQQAEAKAKKELERAAKEQALKGAWQNMGPANREVEFEAVREAWENNKAVYGKTRQPSQSQVQDIEMKTDQGGIPKETQQEIKEAPDYFAVARTELLTTESVGQTVGQTSPDEQTITSRPSIYDEIEANLRVAMGDRGSEPVPFRTEIWETQGDEIRELSLGLQLELAEAYTDMYLANNVVWLLKEINSGDGKLTTSYIGLCNRIYERLNKISKSI